MARRYITLMSFIGGIITIIIIIIVVRRLFSECKRPLFKPKLPPVLVVPPYIVKNLNELMEQLKSDYPGIESRDMYKGRDGLLEKKDQTLKAITDLINGEKTGFNKILKDKYDAKYAMWAQKENSFNECRKAQSAAMAAKAQMPSTKANAALLEGLMHYVVPVIFIIVIILICGGMASMGGGDSSSNEDNSSSQYQSSSKKPGWSFLPSWLNPGYSANMFFNRFSTSHSENAVDRPIVVEGRCGDKWIDAGTNCYNLQSPTPYKVSSKNPNEDNKDVYMPFLIQDTFFLPQCEETFVYDEEGNPQRTNKQYYTDNGLSCEKLSTPKPNPLLEN